MFCAAWLLGPPTPRPPQPPQPSTPTMITERVTCLVRSERSFASMINLREVSLQFHGGLTVVPNIMIIGWQLSGS
jgi:hypothetical protein